MEGMGLKVLVVVAGGVVRCRVHLKHQGHPIVGDAAYAQDW